MLVLNVWRDADVYRVDNSIVTIPDTRDDAGYSGGGVWAAQRSTCQPIKQKASSGPHHAPVSRTLFAEGLYRQIAI